MTTDRKDTHLHSSNDNHNAGVSDGGLGMNGIATSKILGIIGLLAAVTMATAGYGLYKMNRIGHELEKVAEHDLPLSGIVTKVTVHHLEQAVSLQRLLRYGEEMQHDNAKRQLFDETVERFELFANLTGSEFIEAKKMVAGFLKEMDAGAHRAELENIEKALTGLGAECVAYEKLAREVTVLLREGAVEEAMDKMDDIEAAELKVNTGLEEIMNEIKPFTGMSEAAPGAGASAMQMSQVSGEIAKQSKARQGGFSSFLAGLHAA